MRAFWALVVELLGAMGLLGLAGNPLYAQEADGLAAAAALEQAVTEAIGRAEKSVVAIARVRRDNTAVAERDRNVLAPRIPSALFVRPPDPTDPSFIPHEYGTGVILDAGGRILTNYHVLGDPQGSDYFVWSERRPFAAQVLAADPWLDLAVLKVDATGLQPVVFGDTKGLKKGQFVVTLGNPFAIARDGEASASWGIISNLLRAPQSLDNRNRREIAGDSQDSLHHFGTLIQTDARLNLGTSGGALVNLRGEMIGLTTALTALSGVESAAGFAIPVDDDFQRAVATLKEGRIPAYGFLGVAPGTLSAAERRQGKFGVRVIDVVAGTPAAQAGLRVDDTITHVNGAPVFDSDRLIRLVGGKGVGEVVELTVERPGAETPRGRNFKTSLALAKKYIASARPAYATVSEPTWRGLHVDFATAVPQFSLLGTLVDPRGCVGIVRVAPDSPAWKAGLRPGDFISHVAGSRVATPEQFHAATQGREGPVELKLTTGQGADALRTVSP